MKENEKNETLELTNLQKFILGLNGVIAIMIVGLSAFYPAYFSDMLIYIIKAAMIFHAVITATLFYYIIIKKNPEIKSLTKNKKKLPFIILIWALVLVFTIDANKTDGFSELYSSILTYALTFGTWCSIFMGFGLNKKSK